MNGNHGRQALPNMVLRPTHYKVHEMAQAGLNLWVGFCSYTLPSDIVMAPFFSAWQYSHLEDTSVTKLSGDQNKNIPAARDVKALKPTFAAGALHTGVLITTFVTGIWLSLSQSLPVYFFGQALLAFSFLHAFVLLHECGHNTLFPQRALNRVVGHLSGFLTVIPFWNWQRVHARHHRYTGWQDLDATTASLVPRPIAPWERRAIDFVWRAWIPVFALTYRIQNYWNLPRIAKFIGNGVSMRRIRINTLIVLAGYGVILLLVGPMQMAVLFGPAFLLHLIGQEALILSQHTHVPQRISNGRDVQPFSRKEQAAYTRSIKLPTSVSALLLHVDAHELHHMYPSVPGYLLRRIHFMPDHEVNWWLWIKTARGMRGTDFLFRNWNETGVRV